jgi:hypothetical protein
MTIEERKFRLRINKDFMGNTILIREVNHDFKVETKI